MMRGVIPLGDSLARDRRPWVTYGLIAACVLVFLFELTLRGAALDQFVGRFGAVPRLVLGALAGDPRVPRTELLTLFSSQFVHAGFLHLGGNLLFLWVFGPAVEDRLGSPAFLGFYLAAGALAGVVQCLVDGADTIPLIGASGAIAAVLGLYFLSYPTAWVRVLAPVLFFFWTFDLPAVLVLAFWFVGQFFSGLASITQASHATTGGVAVWAHVAGFLIGAGTTFLLPASRLNASPQRGGGVQRADAPGPARLVSSVADLAALLLGARLVLRFFGLVGARSPLAPIGGPILGVTQPIVAPFEEVVPALRVAGGVLETYTLVAIVSVYVVAGLVGQLFVRR
jgi:membrane associated rhomboid family serine protease